MTSVTPSNLQATPMEAPAPAAVDSDHWQRRFGVPWDRVDRAARAVLDRAAAASKAKFADINGSTPVVGSQPA